MANTKEEKILTQALLKTADRGSQFHLFCVYTRMGYNSILPFFKEGFKEEARPVFVQMYNTREDLKATYKTEDDFISFIKEEVAKQNYEKYVAMADCAAFVFAHSLLDGILDDLLDITSTLAQDFWKKKVGDKTVSLSEMALEGMSTIYKEKIDAYVKELKNKAIQNKIKLLMEITQPIHSVVAPEGYSFDLTRIKLINEERNTITHEKIKSFEVNEILEKIAYLNNTGHYLINCIKEKFQLQATDPEILISYVKAR